VSKQLMYFERYAKELAPAYNMARDLFLVQNVFPEMWRASWPSAGSRCRTTRCPCCARQRPRQREGVHHDQLLHRPGERHVEQAQAPASPPAMAAGSTTTTASNSRPWHRAGRAR
jgi:hypothetical protein